MPITERDALTRAVLAQPDDDLPRLVYADWLDEHEEPERAELIRLQCRSKCQIPFQPRPGSSDLLDAFDMNPVEAGDFLRGVELLRKNQRRWAHRVAFESGPPIWRRGFIDEVWVRAPNLMAVYRYVFWEHPVSTLHYQDPAFAGEFLTSAAFPRCRRIVVHADTVTYPQAVSIRALVSHSQADVELRTRTIIPASTRRVLTRWFKRRIKYVVEEV